jgi:hypothetical protein
LRRLGIGPDPDVATAHGFRATASTLLNESGLWNPDAIERQLAHAENNEVRRAYLRGEHWEERVRMMALSRFPAHKRRSQSVNRLQFRRNSFGRYWTNLRLIREWRSNQAKVA